MIIQEEKGILYVIFEKSTKLPTVGLKYKYLAQFVILLHNRTYEPEPVFPQPLAGSKKCVNVNLSR